MAGGFSAVGGELFFSVIFSIVAYVGQALFFFVSEKRQLKKDKRAARNREALERINMQLGTVFGPMRGLVLTSHSAFTILVERWHSKNDVHAFLSEVVKEVKEGEGPSYLQQDYMLWVEHILQPTNRKLADIILQQASGFDRMPSNLANLVAHC